MADTYLTLVFGSEVSAAAGGVGQVQTDLAVLVADGASPTQAHVVSVANDLSSLFGGDGTNLDGVGAASAAMLIVVDTTVIPTVSVLRGLFNQALQQAASQGLAL